ncbi:hypothetical protein [Arcicella rosea]|uniref:Uncharacterized protein n=1 Tax=Arcicella rosea TaxID=502909 RepID=A0A841ESE7_9BACT|nr:hypothetical protein [Arcicella rosea]MBB6005214.1 hypothetical protein [Arcicella rosea]
MNAKKKLSEMTVDELYAEKRRLDDAIPSAKNTKYLLASISFMVITIALAIYAMKDSFSYILTGIILWMVYSFIQKIKAGNEIIKEIKSRR